MVSCGKWNVIGSGGFLFLKYNYGRHEQLEEIKDRWGDEQKSTHEIKCHDDSVSGGRKEVAIFYDLTFTATL